MRLKTELIHGVFIVTFEGERLDAPQAEGFLSAMQGFVKKGNVFILLDMSNIVFMDSTGLGSMIRALKEIYNDGQLVICGVTAQVKSLLKITHLDKVFTIARNRDDAFAIFSVLIAPVPSNSPQKPSESTNNDTVIDTDFYDHFIHQKGSNTTKKPTERRRHKRIPQNHIIDEEIFVYCENIKTKKKSNGVILNISEGGVLMLSTVFHKLGDKMHVEFAIGTAFNLSEIVIVRSINKGKYGMEFVHLSAQAKAFLTRLGGSVRLNNPR